MPSRLYAGRSARSRRAPIIYSCPCGERFKCEAWLAVDSGDAGALKSLEAGVLNRVTCPACANAAELQVPVVYHDLEAPRLVLVLPDGLRHRELEERARFFEELAGDREPPPLYVVEAPVVFGAAGLRAVLAPPPSESAFLTPASGERATTPVRVEPVSQRDVPTVRELPAIHEAPTAIVREAPIAREPIAREPIAREPAVVRDVPVKPARDVTRDARARSDREATVPRATIPEPHAKRRKHKEEDSEQHTKVRVSVPDPRSAMIERWIAGREGPTAFLVDEKVLVCVALPAPSLECFVPGPLELRVQLHRLPTYPIVSITLVAPHAPGRKSPEVDRVVVVPLDVARAAHRVVLDALGRKSRVTVELYDADYLPVVTHHLESPLEENVRHVMQDARDALERIAPPGRAFERARQQLLGPGYERLGRAPVDLPDEDVEPLERPGAVLEALKKVQRWSEPGAEAYLLELGSVPLPLWRATRARVVRRALDIGIHVPRTLVERSAREHAAPLPSWNELLALQLRRFTEVSARLKPNDLSAKEEADNWQNLLRECDRASVAVDEAARRAAQAAQKRARAGEGAGVDLRALDTAELEALLERKELRREAALILCERHEAPSLPALFSAVRRMARNEANVVLPAVVAFGAPVEKWLIEGVKSRRSFMRQGCALALGSLRTPLAAEALAKLLVFEPTEIWPEIARALGDLGAPAVMPLVARLREAPSDVEQRDRITEALAQIAARGAKGSVEALAGQRDGHAAQAAQRALARVAEVRAADESLRKGNPAEHTVVRGFSRRFYDALAGEVELDPSELEELEELEELDDDALSAEPDESPDERPPDERTDSDLPALRTRILHTDENTAPTPKGTLPQKGSQA